MSGFVDSSYVHRGGEGKISRCVEACQGVGERWFSVQGDDGRNSLRMARFFISLSLFFFLSFLRRDGMQFDRRPQAVAETLSTGRKASLNMSK